MKAFVNSVRAFAREEDGVALTEYLILLALLVGGVITAVTLAKHQSGCRLDGMGRVVHG